MNCQYCQQPCTNARNPVHFYCRPCWATFYYSNADDHKDLEWIELWTQIKDQKYMVRLFPLNQTTELKSTKPVDPNNPQSGYYHEIVLELNYLADVNPTNIQSKVKTMLTFL